MTAQTLTADTRQVLDVTAPRAQATEGGLGVQGSARIRITATGATSNLVATGGNALLNIGGDGITSGDYSIPTRSSWAFVSPNYRQVLDINATNDNDDEPNERMTVGLTGLPSGFRAGTTAEVLLIDNDPTAVTLARTGGSGAISEASGTATITVTLGRDLVAGETVTVPLAVGGTGISATDYTLLLSTASGLNEGVTLNVAAPHSAAQPAVVFTGTGTETEQVATLTLTALDDTADEGASETLTVGFGSGNRAVMSNLDRASGMGTAGTTPGGSVSLVITDNDTADTTAPTLSSATVNGLSLVLTWNEPLDPLSLPAASAFTVRVAGTVRALDALDLHGPNGTLTLTLASAVTAGQTVTASYAVPSTNPIRDAAGNNAAALTNEPVTNNTAASPALVFQPASLTVAEGGEATYTVRLATNPSADVTVTVAGFAGTDVTVDTDSVTAGDQATLTFTSGGTGNWATPQTVTVSAAEDGDSTNDSVTLSHTAAGGGYGSVTGSVSVAVTDAGHDVLVTGSLDAHTLESPDLFGQSDDDHEPEHAASATAMACEAAVLHGATPGPDEFDNRPLWEAPDRIKTRSLGPLTFAERRTRRKEYKVRSDQDPNLYPGDPLDLPDLRAGFEDSHLPGIVREIVDLAAERLCADGTMLADERESLIWGLVNCFHAQTQRLDRALDRMEPELRDLQRAQDGSEVKSRELELLTDRAHNTADRRDALEIFRDCAADAYRARTGEVWRPRHGSHTSRTGTLTSAAVDARDFMRARKDRATMAHLPEGTLVAIAGGKDVQDPAAVIARLDKAREKYADMVLVHGGGPGVEKIAARWAERNGIQQIVCKPDWNRHGRAAPFRRNDDLLNLLPKGVIAFPGSGITDNLVDKARQLGIPVQRVAA